MALDAAEALGGAEQAEGGELVADDIAGRKAEKLVYMHELTQVGKSLKKHGLGEKANQLVKWWRKEGLECTSATTSSPLGSTATGRS